MRIIVNLYDHQKQALELTDNKNRVAYYHDMGLGKTFTGGEKLVRLAAKVNLVVCQKSKISDWIEHFKNNYDFKVFDLSKPKELSEFCGLAQGQRYTVIGVINYDLIYRRKELAELKNFTLMLDESSLIQHETAKRSKFILKKLNPLNVILLSGTPTGGKYENLWTQLYLLGWNISKETYWNMFVISHFEDMGGFPVRFIDGYKNVERLKKKMREYGCHFLKSDEVLNLPAQIFHKIKVTASKMYLKFKKDRVVKFQWDANIKNTCDPTDVGETELIGDNTFKSMLYERQLCAQYSEAKIEAFEDLVESTEDRLIVFYNFTSELETLKEINRPISIVNGQSKNLNNYDTCNNSVTFIQYQAGAMGLNLQKANKIIYFSPPLSSELYEQSKKRINRIGQDKTCFYYNLIVKGSIEERIYKTLEMRKDFTEALFEEV